MAEQVKIKLEGYSKDYRRITVDGKVVALVQRMSNDTWRVFDENDRLIESQPFITPRQAFNWWRSALQSGGPEK